MASTTQGKRVLIVGPGFIGGNVLQHLVEEQYNVTGFVRRQQHASQIESWGAKAALGDLNDKAKITELTTQNDIIFHTATADHLPSVQAILEGVKARAKQGQSTIYIHTSGTSILDDNVDGQTLSEKVYHDDVRSEIDSVPDSAPHREIDLAIVNVQKELGDKAKLSIMIPPLIYGFNPDHKRLTIQIPTLSRFAMKHGFAPFIGTGAPVESNIHVLDLARAYIVLLHHMESVPASETLANPYYFCETTGDHEPSWKEVATVIGDALHRAGKIEDPVPRTVPKELYKDLFGDFTAAVIGLNSRSRANRLRALGWKPVEKSWKDSYVEDELPELLKEDCGEFKGYTGVAAG